MSAHVRPAAALAGLAEPMVPDACGPELDFNAYFLGKTRGYGLLESRGGAVWRQFIVDIDGRRTTSLLELDERLVFDDGEILRRHWSVRHAGPGRYEATAPDVAGIATGRADGNAIRWRYRLRLPLGGRDWHIAMDDRMLLLADGVLMSRVRMSKCGIDIASMTVSYRRLD